MAFKQICRFLLSLLAIAAVANRSTSGTTTGSLQNVYNGLLGLQKILAIGEHNNEPIIPRTTTDYNEIVMLYDLLHNITAIYEAQYAARGNNLPLRPILQAMVDDACTLIKAEIGTDIACSSYSDVMKIQLELDLYFLVSTAADQTIIIERLAKNPEGFLNGLPCEDDNTPLDMVESLGSFYICQ